MANNPSTLAAYNGQVDAPSTEYPYGSARDDAVPGDLTGTPRVAAELKDLQGFQQSILDEASIVPSGVADEVGDSQYLDGLLTIASRTVDTVALMTVNTNMRVGQFVVVQNYSASSNSGVLFFKVVAGAAPSPDGGKEIDHDTLAIHFVQNLPVNDINPKQWGAEWDDSTDDSVAVQAWVDYCGINDCSGRWPAGIGRFTGVLINTEYQGLTLRGVGKRRTSAGLGATVFRNNGTTAMLAMTGTGTSTGLEISGFSFRQSSAAQGEFFASTKSLSEMIIGNCDWLLINSSKGFLNIAAPSITNCKFPNHYGTAAAGQSISPYYIESQTGGSYFNLDFVDWFINSNATAIAPMLRLRDTSGGATNFGNTFSRLTFELCASGGAIHASSITESQFTSILCDDSSTLTAHVIHLDTDVTASSTQSLRNTFIGCDGDESDGTFDDLHIESAGPGSQTVLINCHFGHADIEGPAYTSINSLIDNENSGQPPLKIISGVITVPENGNVTFQEGMSVPEMQSGITGVIVAGGNEVVNFANTFSNIPKVTVSHVGATDKAGPAQQDSASTTQVTIYNHGTSSSTIDWVAVGAH